MNMKLGLVSALALIAATPAAAQGIAMQPFPVDHEVRVDSEADARRVDRHRPGTDRRGSPARDDGPG